MGRMKEVYIQIMNENGGIPKDMTIGDIARMRDLEIYNWQEYERESRTTYLQVDHPETANVRLARLPKDVEYPVGFPVVGVTNVNARPLKVHPMAPRHVGGFAIVHKPKALLTTVVVAFDMINPPILKLRGEFVPLED